MNFRDMMSDLMSRLQDVKTVDYREPELKLWINQAYVWLVRRVAPIDRKDLLVSSNLSFVSGSATLPTDFGTEQAIILDNVIRVRKIEPSDSVHVQRSSLYAPSYTANDPKSVVYYFIEDGVVKLLPVTTAPASSKLHYYKLPVYMAVDGDIPIVREFYHDIIVTKAEGTARRRKNITGWENVDALAEKELKSIIDVYGVETELDRTRPEIAQ